MPFKSRSLSYQGGQIGFQGLKLSLWDSYGLSQFKADDFGSGSISEDARGRWYLNVSVSQRSWPTDDRAAQLKVINSMALGIDLGLKEHMTGSDGSAVPAQQFYRDMEPKLATAQRAGKKFRARAIHAKIANRRKDFLHKLSTRQVASHQAIFVGNVNAAALSQTRLAKSVLDAGWSSYRTMLQYKCHSAGVWFNEVSEAYSTQDCSVCSARTGPKGLSGLGIRQWVCSVCGAEHDRDVNAAVNIKRNGLVWLDREFAKVAGASVSHPVNFTESVEARAFEAGLNKGFGGCANN